MKRIINKGPSVITFPDFEFSIGPREVKEVSYEIFAKVINSKDIEEFIAQPTKIVEPKVEEKIIDNKQ